MQHWEEAAATRAGEASAARPSVANMVAVAVVGEPGVVAGVVAGVEMAGRGLKPASVAARAGMNGRTVRDWDMATR